jgi:hypothetical protein
MEMPFGKHEGEDIEDLPTGYIVWCLKNIEGLDEEIEQDMDYELKKRTDIQRMKWAAGDWRAKK